MRIARLLVFGLLMAASTLACMAAPWMAWSIGAAVAIFAVLLLPGRRAPPLPGVTRRKLELAGVDPSDLGSSHVLGPSPPNMRYGSGDCSEGMGPSGTRRAP